MKEFTVSLVDLPAQQKRIAQGLSRRVEGVFAHGKYILGPEVSELEERLGSKMKCEEVVSCSSGSDALLLALMSFDIGPGDAVLVPAFSFVATADVVARLGAKIIFVDVDPISFMIDPVKLRMILEDFDGIGLRPAAVIAVDLFGRLADYAAIKKVTDEYKLGLIADGAQSFGATCQGFTQTQWVDCATTSFFPTKPLGCYGDGGALFCNSKSRGEVLRSLRVHGKNLKFDEQRGRLKSGGNYCRVGMNARLDTLQAAILLEKLTIFEDELKARASIAQRYMAVLNETPLLVEHCKAPFHNVHTESTWAQFTFTLRDNGSSESEYRKRRQHIQDKMGESGVEVGIYYDTPLHLIAALKKTSVSPHCLPVAESLSCRVLSLPVHPYLTDSQVESVTTALCEALS